jgi:hypothetical protein
MSNQSFFYKKNKCSFFMKESLKYIYTVMIYFVVKNESLELKLIIISFQKKVVTV